VRVSAKSTLPTWRWSGRPLPASTTGTKREEQASPEAVPDPGVSPDAEALATVEGEYVTALLHVLDARSRRIVELRFGIGDEHQRTLDEIGSEMGVTRERVRQIVSTALVVLAREAEKMNTADVLVLGRKEEPQPDHLDQLRHEQSEDGCEGCVDLGVDWQGRVRCSRRASVGRYCRTHANQRLREIACRRVAGKHGNRWTRASIIEAIYACVEVSGRPPSAAEWKRGGDHPSYNAVSRVFGSWSAALRAAGWQTGRGRATVPIEEFERAA
jgi:hypothetical protein